MATTVEQADQQDDGGNVSVVDILRGLILPHGFGFRPTDNEIILHYLKPKVEGQQIANNLIEDIGNAYDHDPEYLSNLHDSMTTGTSPKWYFYTTRSQHYTGRSLYERVTPSGYWKPSRKAHISIENNNANIGFKKKFTFYSGRRPQDQETEWTIIKYSLPENEYENASQLKDLVVLYRDEKGSTVSTDAETSAPSEIATNVPEMGSAPASLKRKPEHQSVHASTSAAPEDMAAKAQKIV